MPFSIKNYLPTFSRSSEREQSDPNDPPPGQSNLDEYEFNDREWSKIFDSSESEMPVLPRPRKPKYTYAKTKVENVQEITSRLPQKPKIPDILSRPKLILNRIESQDEPQKPCLKQKLKYSRAQNQLANDFQTYRSFRFLPSEDDAESFNRRRLPSDLDESPALNLTSPSPSAKPNPFQKKKVKLYSPRSDTEEQNEEHFMAKKKIGTLGVNLEILSPKKKPQRLPRRSTKQKKSIKSQKREIKDETCSSKGGKRSLEENGNDATPFKHRRTSTRIKKEFNYAENKTEDSDAIVNLDSDYVEEKKSCKKAEKNITKKTEVPAEEMQLSTVEPISISSEHVEVIEEPIETIKIGSTSEPVHEAAPEQVSDGFGNVDRTEETFENRAEDSGKMSKAETSNIISGVEVSERINDADSLQRISIAVEGISTALQEQNQIIAVTFQQQNQILKTLESIMAKVFATNTT